MSDYEDNKAGFKKALADKDPLAGLNVLYFELLEKSYSMDDVIDMLEAFVNDDTVEKSDGVVEFVEERVDEMNEFLFYKDNLVEIFPPEGKMDQILECWKFLEDEGLPKKKAYKIGLMFFVYVQVSREYSDQNADDVQDALDHFN